MGDGSSIREKEAYTCRPVRSREGVSRVAVMDRNGRRSCCGIGGAHAVEWLAANRWNGWRSCRGIGGRITPEYAKVGQRLGRIQERRASIAQYYDVEIECNETQKRVTDLRWTKKATREQRSVLTGCYVIEASHVHADLSAKEIWGLYMTLRRVEDAFRSLKTDLGIRPVYHQTAKRTEAHLWISVLAYHLLAVIERQLREASDTRRWSSIRGALSTHQRMTVLVTDEKDRVHHIRISGRPEAVHREIYRKLRMTDPLRREHRMVDRRL